MRQPITDLAENLMWSNDGTVWATWRLGGLAYGRRAVKEKRVVKDLHRMLLRGLSGEALLQGVAVSVNPTTVVERQIKGIDLEQCPLWVSEADANLDRLSELPLGDRVFYLSVPLSNPGSRRWSAPMRQAWGSVVEQVGLPRAHPREAELEVRRKQALQVKDAIPGAFNPVDVNPAEHLWLAVHHQQRGWLDTPPEDIGLVPADTEMHGGSALPEPVLDPGAYSDVDNRRINPFSRRVLKVTNPSVPPEDACPSYQALMVMASTPQGGLAFPGSELMARLDEWGPEIDWAIRMKINGRDEVMRANRKAVRELNDQFDQREGNDGGMGHHELDHSAELLQEYQALFANDRLEVEVEHTIILAVGASSFEDAAQQGSQVARLLGSADFRFEQPIGREEDLWWAMQIGVPTKPLIRKYAQYTSSDKFARLVPLVTTQLGGRRGPAFALNTSTARSQVIHLDFAGYPELNKSGSVVWVGELGSGKSYSMKTCCSHLVAMGGQYFCIDRSNEGEWATFARALDPDAVVVDVEDLHWSMDPVQLLPIAEGGADLARVFVTCLLDVGPRERQGMALGRVLEAGYLGTHGLTSLRQVMAHLLDSDDPDLHELGEALQNQAKTALGPLVFNDELPPVPPDATSVVWRTNGMKQPTADELASPHRYRSLSLETMFSRAYYRLVVATARRWIFSDITRAAALVTDEGYDINRNPENSLDLETIVREGRRCKGMLFAGSHDPEHDFGTDTMRRLIPTRVVMRHTDVDLARSSIRFLGIDEDDPEFESMVEQLVKDTSPVRADEGVEPGREGECYIRDAFGAVGDAKILGPAQPALHEAVESTPPKSKVSL